MLPRFFVDSLLLPPGPIELGDAAAHHALRVLRLRVGDPVELFNGDGHPYPGRVASAERGRVAVQLLARGPADPAPVLELTLAQGLAGGDRMDRIVEKAVELGVARIAPLLCARSVTRLDPARAARRAEHWRQIVIAACMQCGRNRVPALAALTTLDRFVGAGASAGSEADTAGRPPTMLLLAPDAEARLVDIAAPRGPVTLLIGPESGLTETESLLATRNGYTPVRLGPRVLRTETAGAAALAALQARFGDF